MPRALIGNFRGPQGIQGPQGEQGVQGLQGPKGDKGIVDANSVIEFEDFTVETEIPSPSSALQNILTGRSISSLLSNIRAFLINTLTTEKIANNFATSDTKMVAAAPTVKQLKDEVNVINTNLTIQAAYPTEFKNGWTANWSYFKMTKQANRVYISGILNPGTLTSDTKIAILDSSLVPKDKPKIIKLDPPPGQGDGGLVCLWPTGEIKLFGDLPSASWYSIDTSWDVV